MLEEPAQKTFFPYSAVSQLRPQIAHLEQSQMITSNSDSSRDTISPALCPSPTTLALVSYYHVFALLERSGSRSGCRTEVADITGHIVICPALNHCHHFSPS